VTSLDLSPDGRTVAFIDADGTLNRIDTRTRRATVPPQTVPGHMASGAEDVRFSNDGSLLAIGGLGPQILDARTQRVVSRVRTERLLYGLRFSPDGRTLFAVVDDFSARSLVQRFDVRSGEPLGVPQVVARGMKTVSLMITRDGRRLVTSVAGGPIAVRDARTLRPLRQLRLSAAAAALSPDDRILLVGGRDGSVRLLDLVTGRARTASGRHDGAVTAAAFSADGRTVVTAGEDGRAIVWDVRRAAAGETLVGHAGVITGVVISRDGRTLYSSALDGKVLIWDLAGDRRVGRRFDIGPGNPVGSLAPLIASHALSPDGRVLAIGHLDGTVTLFDARTLRERSTFRAAQDGPVFGMGYLPGGLLVVGGEEGYLALVDPERGELVRRLRGHGGWVIPPSFSADGRLMVTVSPDTLLLWRLRSGEPVGPPRRRAAYVTGFPAAALSPDGRTLALTSSSGIEILDTATLQPRGTLPPPAAGAFSLAFTSDGRYLAVGRSEGWTELWSTDTWRQVPGELGGHSAEVFSQASSPDGRTLATGSTDGTIRLFDVDTRKPLGAPLRAVPNRLVEPRFTPDGAFLFAITDAGQAYRWDVRAASWARHACDVAGRELTREEWRDALPDREYAPACG
jgi:WD40 repeat protein